jgi:hypothetical protein
LQSQTRRLSAFELGIRVSVITNGNKAPGAFGSRIIRFRRSKPRRLPASGISLKKAAPPAPFGDGFFYNHVLPL